MQDETIDDEVIEYLESYLTDSRRERMAEVIQQRTRHLCVALEDIYQPHNTAAVIRSCECFGVQDIHIIENKYDFEKTIGVAMGADKWLSMKRYNEADGNNTVRCIESLKKAGYKIAATTLRDDAIPVGELNIEEPIALMLGTELTGLSDTAHEHADVFVHLPMFGFTQSFNISVCAALSLYDLRTRLNQSAVKWELPENELKQLKFEWLKKSIRASDKLIQEFKENRTQS